ncbi:MAG TPA: hypothetical protein VGQ83_15055 [Polyangia bacterium]|jgi:hypothetical protein
MAHFLIESPHTKEECLQALDEITARDPKLLDRYEFGCMAGDHRGWAIIDAPNENQARQAVPEFLRKKSSVVPLNKFTADQVRSFHNK